MGLRLIRSREQESGLTVILHDWNEIPQIGHDIGVPAGFKSYISGEKQVRTTINQPPWSTCKKINETTGEPYSKRNCLHQCETEQTVEYCGCRLWYQPGNQQQCRVAETAACSFYLSFCKILKFKISSLKFGFLSNSVGSNSVSDSCASKCPKDCEETTHDYTSSYTNLFSTNTIEDLKSQLQYTDRNYGSEDYDGFGEPLETPAENLTETFFKENIIAVEIGYSHFNVENSLSSPDQTFNEFVSSIGGLLGLVAGISFLTIYEFIEYPFIKLFSMFKSKQTHPEPRRHVVAGFQASNAIGKYPYSVYPTTYYRR